MTPIHSQGKGNHTGKYNYELNYVLGPCKWRYSLKDRDKAMVCFAAVTEVLYATPENTIRDIELHWQLMPTD